MERTHENCKYFRWHLGRFWDCTNDSRENVSEVRCDKWEPKKEAAMMQLNKAIEIAREFAFKKYNSLSYLKDRGFVSDYEQSKEIADAIFAIQAELAHYKQEAEKIPQMCYRNRLDACQVCAQCPKICPKWRGDK